MKSKAVSKMPCETSSNTKPPGQHLAWLWGVLQVNTIYSWLPFMLALSMAAQWYKHAIVHETTTDQFYPQSVCQAITWIQDDTEVVIPTSDRYYHTQPTSRVWVSASTKIATRRNLYTCIRSISINLFHKRTPNYVLELGRIPTVGVWCEYCFFEVSTNPSMCAVVDAAQMRMENMTGDCHDLRSYAIVRTATECITRNTRQQAESCSILNYM